MEAFQGATYVSLRSVDQRRAYVHAVEDGMSVRLDDAYAHAAVWAVQRHYSGEHADAEGSSYVLLRSVYGRYLGAPVCGCLPTSSRAATQREFDELETKGIMWRGVATGSPNTVLLQDASGRYLRANPSSCLPCRAAVSVSTGGCLGTAMQWEVEVVPQLEVGGSLDLPIERQSEWAKLLAWVCLLLLCVLAWVQASGSGSASAPAATGSQAHSPSTS